MNVPDVVQTLSTMTVLSAVSWSWIQFWSGGKPKNPRQMPPSPIAARMPLNSPSGATRKIHSVVIAAELAIAGK